MNSINWKLSPVDNQWAFCTCKSPRQPNISSNVIHKYKHQWPKLMKVEMIDNKTITRKISGLWGCTQSVSKHKVFYVNVHWTAISNLSQFNCLDACLVLKIDSGYFSSLILDQVQAFLDLPCYCGDTNKKPWKQKPLKIKVTL